MLWNFVIFLTISFSLKPCISFLKHLIYNINETESVPGSAAKAKSNNKYEYCDVSDNSQNGQQSKICAHIMCEKHSAKIKSNK